jgi:hypothetical protein
MTRAWFVGGLLLLTSASAAPQPPRVPVLVELFTSEGCSSCPPADDLLAQLEAQQPVARAEIIPLGLHVDYWDNLGWKDPFAQAAFTARQRAYAGSRDDDRVYTPQVVVDGGTGVVGSDAALVTAAVVDAARQPHLPLRVTAGAVGDRVRLVLDLPAAPPGSEPLDVFAALTERAATSEVARGENRGRTLRHVAVVRVLQNLGRLDGDAAVLRGDLPIGRRWAAADLRAVVWIQGATTRRITGAAAAPVER